MGVVNKIKTHETGASDPILTRIANEDKTPWYKKPNLRYLYFMLFPTCMAIESTSGFDSQLINALQIVPPGLNSSTILRAPRKELSARLTPWEQY